MSDKTRKRVQEMETLLATLRDRGCISANVNMWFDRASSFASDEEQREMQRELNKANSEYDAASTELTALVARTRTESPEAIEAWVDAHEQYLGMMIAKYTAEGGSVAESMIDSYKLDRERWAEVRAGKQPFPTYENGWYDPDKNDQYRALFGIDMKTLEPVA